MVDGISPDQFRIAIVIAIGLIVGILALVVGQRTIVRLSNRISAGKTDPLVKDPILAGSQAEKRQAYRRTGKNVDVQITDTQLQHEPWNGSVVDRSMNGLRLNSEKEVAVDDNLNIRVVSATTMPWIEVKVVHCKESRNGWEIGCQFTNAPTWNLLLMFG